ncbi:MAG: type II CAAX endopeptidase family protein [Firmicutes bacterium]|nr:type II CAAX endopeptidase family protein [Bacillota bacterium]
MKRTHSLSSCPTGQETVAGGVYLIFQLLLLPSILSFVNGKLTTPLSDAELNFVFYLINFLATILIYHRLLGHSARQAAQHPAYFCQAVILGLAAYYALFYFVRWLISLLVPGFTNYNDAAIAAMSRSGRFLTVISTVILVPPAEECAFRGLIFRNLYGKSRWAAYAVSMLAFACIHILGYIGTYSPLELVMAVLQYLPAGLSLAWAYTKADSIFAPILIHACINLIAVGGLR